VISRTRPYLNLENLISILRDGDVSDPQIIREFEDSISRIFDANRAYAIHQGRLALLLALKILDIGERDEIIVQSFICPYVIDAILELGATPVLADSSRVDFQISPSSIRKNISRKTKAIICAHIYGIPSPIQEIFEIASRNKCYLIEDCAQTMGAKSGGKNIGTYGDLSFFSFNFDKPISLGQGGMLLLNNKELIYRAEEIISHYERISPDEERKILFGFIVQYILTGKDAYKYHLPITFGESLIERFPILYSILDECIMNNLPISEISNRILKFTREKKLLRGQKKSRFSKSIYRVKRRMRKLFPETPARLSKDSRNFLMNSIRASLGIKLLKELDFMYSVRNKNAEYLSKNLDKNRYILPIINEKNEPYFIRYSVLNKTDFSVAEISKMALEKGIEIGNFNWPNPVHLIPYYSRIIKHERENLKESEYLAQNILNIPIHTSIAKEDLASIVSFLNKPGG
jgi:dTDP-4-amino-4,6-dideoxygalactose transaminase